MRSCACISLSGGQGKTTTAFFLALLLARHGQKVLVIDADPQANLTFYLGQDVADDEPTLLEVLTKQVEPVDGIYPTEHQGLFVMPADTSLFKVSEYLSSSGAGAFVLRQRLQTIAPLFDFVVIDVQPSRSQLCLTAAGAADLVWIPVETATKGVNSLMDTLNFLDEQAEFQAFTGEIAGIMPFRDRWVGRSQTNESRESVVAMKELAGDIPILPSIRESEQFKRAIRQGKLLEDINQAELQYPFEVMEEMLNG